MGKRRLNTMNELQTTNEIKVGTNSNPNSVAGAIVALLREHETVEMNTIGAGALNQAVKAVAIGRGFLAPGGQDLIISPTFNDITLNGESRTAMRLRVEKRGR